VCWGIERDGETVLQDAWSPMTVRRGGIEDRGEVFENDGGRSDVVMGMDSFGAGRLNL